MRKPASEKQLAANRANAARSTGPRSPEGKARSAQNARRHGFAASAFAVVRLEELDAVARLKDDAVSLYQPANAQELFAVERIALAQQALLRAARLEAGLFTACLDEALDRRDEPFKPMSEDLAGNGDLEITRAQNRNFALALGFQRLVSRANGWSLFLRYQAQAERHYRRAVEELERLRALRPQPEEDLPNEPISGIQLPEEPRLAPSQTNPFASPSATAMERCVSPSAPRALTRSVSLNGASPAHSPSPHPVYNTRDAIRIGREAGTSGMRQGSPCR